MWDKQIIRQLVEGQDGHGLKYGTIVGETCDGIDVIYKGLLPNSIEIGDIFIVPHMGAYCESTANYFNGFSPAKKEYLEC
jgi:diaminopimelate decarboxylase